MALLLADIALIPGGLIAWIVVGLISGWLAGQVMKGGGYGMIGDIVVGLVGSLVGGFLMGYFVQGRRRASGAASSSRSSAPASSSRSPGP